MAEEAWGDRDLIFANFQAASGLEDYEQCISILESNNWNLQVSLNAIFSEQENQNSRLANAEATAHRNSPIIVDDEMIDVTGNIDFPPPLIAELQRDSGTVQQAARPIQLFFNIMWHERTLPTIINDTETIGALKRMLEIQTGLSPSEINLEGWPSGDSSVDDTTVLSSLNLCSETHLVLHSPAKVTVSPAVYLPCNIPECQPVDKKIQPPTSETTPRVIDVDLSSTSKPSNDSQFISLNVHHDGRDYSLKYTPHQTIKEVKQESYMLTKIPTRQQEWQGWPDGVTDHSRLGTLDLQPDHFLMITSSQQQQSSSTSIGFPSSSLIMTDTYRGNWDSGVTGSPADTDLDEQVISEDDDDEDKFFDAVSSHSIKKAPLLPKDSLDTTDTLVKMQHQFEERYGDFHPAFYIGPLKGAIDEASGESAKERRPLVIYLHHDKSILANIFCSQILCSEQFVSFVSQNCVIWPWDMSHESNRQRFVNLLVQHFGNTAAGTVSKFRDGEYPLLLIVMKSKAGIEVCSVLQANASLDELMTGLMNGYEVFEQTKLVEIKAERERQEREMMKLEQDTAYQESLAADRAKAETEKLRAQAESDRLQQEQLDAQLKEAERVSCEEQLPAEPEKGGKDVTNLLFRFPDGERVARRFKKTEKFKEKRVLSKDVGINIQVVFMYVASKGFSVSDHRVVTNFPRIEFSETNTSQTLEELKLYPQGTLFVEEV